jgi:uncharacterized short protein YbdD (DUF466 family)
LSSRQRDIGGAAGVAVVLDFNQYISIDRNVKPDKLITQTHVLAETSCRQRDIGGAAGVGVMPDFNHYISIDRHVKPDKSITQTHVLAETSCTVSNWV